MKYGVKTEWLWRALSNYTLLQEQIALTTRGLRQSLTRAGQPRTNLLLSNRKRYLFSLPLNYPTFAGLLPI